MKLILNRRVAETFDCIPICYTYALNTETGEEMCEACYPEHHSSLEFVLDRVMNGDNLLCCHIEKDTDD